MITEKNVLNPWLYFCSPVYSFIFKEYIDVVNKITDEYVEKKSKEDPLNPIYPLYQTDNFQNDNRINGLAIEIIKKCENILEHQGYDVSNHELFFVEFWAQKHFKASGHERHIHNNTLLSGFYFLDCPENGCKLIIHDPRPAKEFGTYLPETNIDNATHASLNINFTPEPGQLIILDSYVPHSFSKNENDLPSKFVHFTVSTRYKRATII